MMPSSNIESSNPPLDAIVPSGPLTTRRTVSSRAKAPDLSSSWRLNRFLARAGFGSRRSTEELILKGSVSVNGSFCRDLAKTVTDADDVRVNGRQIHLASPRYLLLHKPTGYVSTRSDRHAERTIFDLLPTESSSLFHVGRLDKDSEGLLLLTNDGDLAQKLLHPSSGIDKEYEVCLDQPFTLKAAAALKKGTWIEGAVARVESVHQFAPTKIKIVLHQGIKRQIRVMLGQLGFKVKRLLRTRIGPLKLRNLDSGHYRELRPEEVEELRTAATRVKVSSKTVKKVRLQRPPSAGKFWGKPLIATPLKGRPRLQRSAAPAASSEAPRTSSSAARRANMTPRPYAAKGSWTEERSSEGRPSRPRRTATASSSKPRGRPTTTTRTASARTTLRSKRSQN